MNDTENALFFLCWLVCYPACSFGFLKNYSNKAFFHSVNRSDKIVLTKRICSTQSVEVTHF